MLATSGCIAKAIEMLASDDAQDDDAKPKPKPKPREKAPVITVAEAARTPQCRTEMAAAIDSLRKELGLGFEAGPPHVETLLTVGVVDLPYARDGIRHIPGFRLQQQDGACRLQFFRQTTHQPGETHSTQSDYGHVVLKDCACQ